MPNSKAHMERMRKAAQTPAARAKRRATMARRFLEASRTVEIPLDAVPHPAAPVKAKPKAKPTAHGDINVLAQLIVAVARLIA